MTTIWQGNVWTSQATFLENGDPDTPITPSSVTFNYSLDNGKTWTELTWDGVRTEPATGEIANVGLGIFVAWVDTTAFPVGLTRYYWASTGVGQGAVPGQVTIRPLLR